MARCPNCDTLLEPYRHDSHDLEGCLGCGGLWLPAGSLMALARTAPGDLATLDYRFLDSGAKPPDGRLRPVCAGCGQPLRSREFPGTGVPIWACADCHRVFVRDGQLRQLQQALAPAVVEAAPVIKGPPPRPVRRRLRLKLGPWPERLPGQPFLSWLVCGMPIWAAELLMLVHVGLLALSWASDPVTPGPVYLALPTVAVAWLVQTLIVTVLLRAIWAWNETGPPLTFWEVYSLVLRVVAFGSVVGVTLRMAFAGSDIGFMMLLGTVVRLVIYWKVVELEVKDIVMMSIIGGLFGGIGV